MGVNTMNLPQIQQLSKTDSPSLCTVRSQAHTLTPEVSRGDKTKARDILAAIRTLKALDEARRPATPEERQVLMRFPGFGPVALGIFPNPVTGHYPDASWQQLGEELQALLTPEDYASAKRTTFTALDQRAHLCRNIRLQVTLFSTISCMALEKRANVTDLILTVL